MKAIVFAYHLDLDSGDAELVTFPYLVKVNILFAKSPLGLICIFRRVKKRKKRWISGLATVNCAIFKCTMLGFFVNCEFFIFWPLDGDHSPWQHHNQIHSKVVSENCIFRNVIPLWTLVWNWKLSLTVDTGRTNGIQNVSLETIS